MRNLLIGLVLLTALGCSDSSSSPSASSSVNLAGNWIGTVTSNSFVAQVGVGTIHATLAQNGNSITGSWNTTYANVANNNAGSLTGLVSGSSVTLTLTSGVPTACPSNVTATLTGSSSMSGTYATFNCTIADGGQFAATKQ